MKSFEIEVFYRQNGQSKGRTIVFVGEYAEEESRYVMHTLMNGEHRVNGEPLPEEAITRIVRSEITGDGGKKVVGEFNQRSGEFIGTGVELALGELPEKQGLLPFDISHPFSTEEVAGDGPVGATIFWQRVGDREVQVRLDQWDADLKELVGLFESFLHAVGFRLPEETHLEYVDNRSDRE